MPNRDGTGPMGMRPRTGRGAGVCAGNEIQGYVEHVTPRWYGWGRGRSRRHRFRGSGTPGWEWHGYARSSREQEVDVHKAQAQDLQEVLQHINNRLDELEKK